MKKHILMIGAASLVALSTLAQADAKKPLAQWTCEDFLAVNESFQPVAVGLGEAVNKTGKVEDAVLDVDGVAKVTPEVVTACQEDKKASFVHKIKDAWSKVKKDV